MFRFLIRSALILALFGFAACGEDSPTGPGDTSIPSNAGFRGPYTLSNWENTGIQEGTTSVESMDGQGLEASFGYNVDLGNRTGLGISKRYVTFSTEAAASGPVTVEWEYTGYHAFYQTYALLRFFAEQGDGNKTQTVDEVDGTAGGGFSFSGTTTFDVVEGESFGFTMGGGHFDKDGRLRGTLTIKKILAPR